MPPLFAASLVHPQPIQHRKEQALTTLALKHLEKLWIVSRVAPKPLTLPKNKQKKTEESFENNVVKRKSILYAFLRLMTSIKERLDRNLRRSLCHTMAETYRKVTPIVYLQLPASLKHLTGSPGQKGAWWPWITNYLLSHSHCWQYVSKRHTFADQCYMGHIVLTWEDALSFQHEFGFSGEPAERKKIGDFELK